jgi:ubiquinone/menaquinone biosynthesis C-methylase UbiE
MPQTEKPPYFYPDLNDKITSYLIKQKESYKGQWEKEENEILNKTEQYIKEKQVSCLLDAGCGTGRLLPRFQGLFDKILAVDADASQIEKARLLVKELGFSEKVTFKVTPAETLRWRRESIDVILCSHVIQHTRTDLVPVLLQKFNVLTKPDALLFILTAYSEKQDYYVKDTINKNSFCETQICKEEFNSLIANRQGELPVHFFSIGTLKEMLAKAGFSISSYKPFHKMGNLEKIDSPSSARDIFVAAKKMKPLLPIK